jgi:uncharacterized protein YbbK (DUF523 family)/uncharacterized protein YbgA (DUF1722 family)
MIRPKIAISACLLGQRVRFDGQGKRAPWLRNELSQHVTWLPLCPEVGIGLRVPRDTLRLVDSPQGARLITTSSGEDHTHSMKRWSFARLEELEGGRVDGFILTSKSPSCGLSRVRIYDNNQVPSASQRGVFAEAVKEKFPLLPVEESGRINDPQLRGLFVERVFAGARLRDFFSSPWTWAELVAFHASEKVLLMAHSPRHQKLLGQLVASGPGVGAEKATEQYSLLFLEALTEPVTTGRHINALQHLAGFCKTRLAPATKALLHESIEGFREGRLPLSVPMTLLESHGTSHNQQWLLSQSYLRPHHKSLGLCNWTTT